MLERVGKALKAKAKTQTKEQACAVFAASLRFGGTSLF
jgi:hypothetical protein